MRICWLLAPVVGAVHRPPVILVPGFGGSNLVGKGSNVNLEDCGSEPYSFNSTLMWLNPKWMTSECWAALIALYFDPSTGHYRSAKDVVVGPQLDDPLRAIKYFYPGPSLGIFGAQADALLRKSMRGIIPRLINFNNLIKAFAANGFVRGDSILAFPYDWRLPPWQIDLTHLQELIENAVRRTGKKATLISHSMGSLVCTYFFNTKANSAWKAQYIERFISINGANGGSPKAVAALLSGHVNTVPFLSAEVLRNGARSIASPAVLVPHPKVYDNDAPLVRILHPSTARVPFGIYEEPPLASYPMEYSLANWTELLPVNGRMLVANATEQLGDHGINDPGVPTFCLWSKYEEQNSTAVAYTYETESLKTEPKEELVLGDGTVPLVALKVCEGWASTVWAHEIPDQHHQYILNDFRFNRFVVSLVHPVAMVEKREVEK